MQVFVRKGAEGWLWGYKAETITANPTTTSCFLIKKARSARCWNAGINSYSIATSGPCKMRQLPGDFSSSPYTSEKLWFPQPHIAPQLLPPPGSGNQRAVKMKSSHKQKRNSEKHLGITYYSTVSSSAPHQANLFHVLAIQDSNSC